ncbi:hypothetical protein KO481_16105 [Nocardia sp. NEAU-G5]|uniref:DUF4267 domain-containing protein n=1 Tax=Nocardia albiluteola TaxID=2842303 RepID=A0ABS6B1E2_9NOCA|nr:hypothetical protein [Nocardia albiluteola]MBU3063043.1 hypothetical protein [Nocardia albiluteola]
MLTAIATLNALVAVVSGVSCLVGLLRPRLALPAGESVTPGITFLLGAYAARALPLCGVTLAVLATGNRTAVAPVLIVAGLAQVGDAALGLRLRNYPMAATCVGLAAVHLGTAAWLALS